MPEPVLMTFDAAAVRYAVTRKTIERWCRQGMLRVIRIGGAVRLNIAESDAAVGAVLVPSASEGSGAAGGAGESIKKVKSAISA